MKNREKFEEWAVKHLPDERLWPGAWAAWQARDAVRECENAMQGCGTLPCSEGAKEIRLMYPQYFKEGIDIAEENEKERQFAEGEKRMMQQ